MIIRKNLTQFAFKPSEDDVAEFQLRPLLADEVARSVELDESGRMTLNPAFLCKLAQKGVVQWSGINDEDGCEFEFTPENLRLLPLSVQRDVGLQVYLGAQLSTEEVKNSASQSK